MSRFSAILHDYHCIGRVIGNHADTDVILNTAIATLLMLLCRSSLKGQCTLCVTGANLRGLIDVRAI